MPRKPIPTVLSETEIQKLTAASLNSPDPEFARRCKAILECGKGSPTNEQVGAIVGMDRKYVGHWRNMWAENKMDGLKSSQGGGVIPLQDVYSMDEQIALLLEDESKRPDEGWTARSLSAELRISESRVRNAMKRMGLTLERNRNWRFPTKTDPAPTKADLIAVYADQNQQAAVFCVSQKPFTTKDAAAVTRNISLSQDLAKSKEILSLPDFIDTAAMRADEHGLQRPISRNLFLKNVIDAQPGNPNLMIQVLFCGGERPIYRGSRVEQVSVFGADSLEKWLGSVEEWSIALNQTELSDPGRGIAASLRHFLDVSDDRTDPILWSKKVLTLPASSDSSDFSSGLPFSLSELMSSEEASASSDVEITADEDVADSEALSDGLASDSSSQTSLQSGSGSGKVQITLDPANPMEALREVMKYVLPTDQLGEKEVGSAFLPLVYDRNSVMCSVVESHDGFPRPDQFDFRTIEGFMNGFNQMEKPMVQLRNKAGEEAAELYNEFIKKKTTSEES